MKRRHWIEIGDEPWCPRGIRQGVTDFCRFVEQTSGIYNAVAPKLVEALQRTGSRRILDLGSGAGGPWLKLQPLLREMGHDVTVCLSDHNPDLEAFERASHLSQQAITYHPDPVDATQVPRELSGFRTMFSAFHHLRTEQARAALADAVAKQEGIAVFECGHRSLLTILCVLPMPLRLLISAPVIRPFRWSRLFWTYLVPALPFVLLWDALVSCLRIYSPDELRDMTAGLNGYRWDIGSVRGKLIPIPITYLIGVPLDTVSESPK